jgi:hypothetical protein
MCQLASQWNFFQWYQIDAQRSVPLFLMDAVDHQNNRILFIHVVPFDSSEDSIHDSWVEVKTPSRLPTASLRHDFNFFGLDKKYPILYPKSDTFYTLSCS